MKVCIYAMCSLGRVKGQGRRGVPICLCLCLSLSSPSPPPYTIAMPTSSVNSIPKLYTLSEVSQHNNGKDCWLIIDGKVYDVTNYLEEHPGGDEVLLSATGKDATDDFEDAGHSNTARETMEEYYIGDFDPSSISLKSTVKQAHNNSGKTVDSVSKILPFAIPLAFLGLAIVVCIYVKKN